MIFSAFNGTTLPRVAALQDFLQVTDLHVRVDLRRRHRGVAEQLLDVPQPDSTLPTRLTCDCLPLSRVAWLDAPFPFRAVDRVLQFLIARIIRAVLLELDLVLWLDRVRRRLPDKVRRWTGSLRRLVRRIFVTVPPVPPPEAQGAACVDRVGTTHKPVRSRAPIRMRGPGRAPMRLHRGELAGRGGLGRLHVQDCRAPRPYRQAKRLKEKKLLSVPAVAGKLAVPLSAPADDQRRAAPSG